jgi:general secretion pathway protein A
MYLDFYDIREKPFNLTPDPRFVFLSKHHKETFAHLLYGINNRVGFIALTGEVGSGKTTVLRALLSQLDADHHRTALIFNPCLSPTELLQNINREFGILADTSNNSSLLEALNQFLLQQNAADRTVVLVIDEAQNLEAPVLEQIRLISNLETDREKLIQIVLSGQPELAEILARNEMRQLSQRITVRYHLRPMDFQDTGHYINHRLEVAGGRGEIIFSRRALKRIYRYSRGLPRLINVASDRALLAGYTRDTKKITSRITAAGIKDMRKNAMFHNRKRLLILIPTSIMLAAFVAGVIFFKWHDFLDYFKASQPVAATEEQTREPPVITGEELFRTMADELGKVPESESARRAFNTLAGFWNVPPIPENSTLNPSDGIDRAALDRKLQLYIFFGNLGALLRLDYPAALELILPGIEGKRFISVVGMDNEQLLVDPPIAGRKSFSFTEIEKHWSGEGFLLWKDFLNLLPNILPGAKEDPIKTLQGLLKEAGPYNRPLTGIYDGDTRSAVKEFQSSRRIDADGIVGGQTLMLLYQSINRFDVPTLTAGRK